MSLRYKLKESFEVESKFGAFFTGNQIEWTDDGEQLVCQHGASVHIFDLSEGHVTGTLNVNDSLDAHVTEDLVTALTATPESVGKYVITSHRSGLLQMWSREDFKLIKTWKSVHKGPVARLAVSHDGDWLATGGSDSCVRLWDLSNFNCVHSLRGCQGVIRPGKKEIYAAGDDCAIRCWEIGNNNPRLTLSSHYSRVTSIVFHKKSHQLVSCGRDSVLCLWNLVNGTLVRTIPVYESLEAMILLPTPCKLPGGLDLVKGVFVATAGEKGVVRVWEVEKSKEVFVQENSQVAAAGSGGLAVINLMFNKSSKSVAVVSADHNIIFHNLNTFNCERLLAGYCDEILDVALVGPEESYLAVACNSPDIKLYRNSDMHCQLLRGHTDLVLTLAVSQCSPCLLASAAKDNMVRIWLLNPEEGSASCVGVGERHTASVGAIAMTRLSTTWLLSAARDDCLKSWRIPADIADTKSKKGIATLSTEFSEIAHSKDINSICISPNDKLAATASQDKTVKLWTLEGLSLLGVLRGHKRGVWCAKFSPTDQILATGSADCTIKLWSISDLSCVKTIEGHEASVLCLDFLSSGSQLLTAGGDGLMKLWTLKSSDCVMTLDAHEGRIWALVVRSDETKLVSGGSDSAIVTWKDTTAEVQEKARTVKAENLLGEQRLSNLMHAKDFQRALELALSLNRPHNALKIVEGIVASDKSRLGSAISNLPVELQSTLVQFALTWNTNTRSYEPAQMVLEHILAEGVVHLNAEELAQALAYTDKHFRRLSQLRSEMHFLSYTAARMSLLPLANVSPQ